jgi:hypothetical protein
VVEGTAFETRHGVKLIVGSNPTSSAHPARPQGRSGAGALRLVSGSAAVSESELGDHGSSNNRTHSHVIHYDCAIAIHCHHTERRQQLEQWLGFFFCQDFIVRTLSI